jgi:predicted O-methyltransferase YrrM
MNPARGILVRLLRAVNLESLHALWERSPLREDGWFRSFRERRAVDAEGRPLPWITYGAIRFLAPRVRPEWRVFEFGCGDGTLWWAARVREVIACEHDAAWRERIAAVAPANATILHVPLEYGGDYARAARGRGPFDLVVVDGRDRVNSAIQSVDALAPGGVILWDNTDRPNYATGLAQLAALGFRRVDFEGIAPVEPIRARTSILYRDGNALGL